MHEHAVTAALTVSFQRYPYPPSGWVETLPKSRGALPLALAAPGHVLLACPVGEALWIGLVAARREERSSQVGVVAQLASGERVDLATGTALVPGTDPAGGVESASGLPRPAFAVPPRFAVEGIARQDGGWWALALGASGPEAPACVGLELAVWTGPAAAPVPEGAGGAGPLRDPADRIDPTPPDDPTGGPPSPPGTELPSGPPVLVRVELVDAAGFEAATGRRVPDPTGDDATYGGWRLP
ncbi:MAG: hypothetical protein ACJ74K_08605 [Actinomycetes bacterium]